MTGKEALTLVDTLLHTANQRQGLNDVQSVVFLETWAGHSYKQIAEQLGYQLDYIKQVGSQLWRSLSQTLGEPVSKRNLQAVLRRYQQSQHSPNALPIIQGKQDWGEAIDVSRFHGRQEELQTLETWILEDSCRAIAGGTALRAIAILGLGGMGKTTLSVKLAQQVQSQFNYVIWRSLQQAPPLELILSEILPILAGTEVVTDCSINTLMKQLHSKRCLLVLDNVESILQDGNRSGQYQAGYESYRQLFDRICDEPHQSCLILTGRDKPSGFAIREGKNLPVRSLQLQGLSGEDGQQILIAKGLDATDSQRKAIVKYFGGNPLALKIAATTIQTLFGGNSQAFLAQGRTVFSDLWDLLDQQFERLSPLQQQIMYWLAINREGVTSEKLHQEILPKVSWRELLEALESLQVRSLIEDQRSHIETENGNLTQQPVIMEYVTERFIQTIEQEITAGNLNLFRTHALIEAQTQDYLRDAQIQLILHPLTERLLTHFATQAQLEKHLCQILASLRHQTAMQTGYAGGNLLNLFCHLKTELKGFDFSDLVIRQAYLPNAVLHDADFTNTQISQTVFAETFGGVVSVTFSPDGQRFATSDTKGDIQIWDTCTGEELVRCRGHQHWTWAIAFSPDGRYLASASDDYLVKLWDVETGQCLQTYFSPDGQTLASSSYDQTIKLWDVKTKHCLKILRGHRQAVTAIAFSPDTQQLASSSFDRMVKLWDSKLGNCLQTLPGHTSWVWSIAFNPNGTQLVSGSYDQTVKLWDIAAAQCLKTLQGHTSPVVCVAYSPDGKLLASSEFDGIIKLWDADTGECRQTFKGHSNSVWSVTFSPNGEWLLSGSFDQTLKLWSVSTGECLQTFAGHEGAVMVARFSPDGHCIISGSLDRTLKLWDIRTGQCYQTLAGHSELVYTLLVASVQFGGDASASLTAFSGSLDESIKLWDLQAHKCWQTLRTPRPYEDMKIRGIQGLTEAQWATLKALGAAS